ncbi:hypothetical protein M9458_044236 [Cirrhinus mrigala]|uniref:Retrotransposon gag domain-containing protein n=1 Tax=Cirrhinus mrigala TaxID=683832 RepID=A0ABD0NGZ9_CIRMR
MPLPDPACLTMSLSMSLNKALQMDPPVSRLPHHHVTEYSATQGSSNFSSGHRPGMDTARLLLALDQGTRSLEGYIQEYLAIAHYSDLPDCALIDFFCQGVNQPLKSRLIREGPRSSLAAFLDFALLCVGSPFTVTFSQPRTPGHSAIMIATPVLKPAHGMAAAPERAHVMAATAEPVHKMATKTVLRHVTAATPESSKFRAAVAKSSQVKAVVTESSKVTADLHEPSQVTADLHESSQVTADLHKPSQVRAGLPESSCISAGRLESSQVMSRLTTQSLAMSPLTPLGHNLMASVLDPPLMSVRAAGIPVASTPSSPIIKESLPPAAALPLMAVTILCIWAAHSAPEVSSLHESAPEVLFLLLPLLWWSLAHPALPVPPQFPGPPHGPGPPSLVLFCPNSPELFVWSVWKPLFGGGYVTNLAGDLRSSHHPFHITLTVAPHHGLRSSSAIALIVCSQSETLYKPWTSSQFSQSIGLC